MLNKDDFEKITQTLNNICYGLSNINNELFGVNLKISSSRATDLISQHNYPFYDCSFRVDMFSNQIDFVVSDGLSYSTIGFNGESDNLPGKFYRDVFLKMVDELKELEISQKEGESNES